MYAPGAHVEYLRLPYNHVTGRQKRRCENLAPTGCPPTAAGDGEPCPHLGRVMQTPFGARCIHCLVALQKHVSAQAPARLARLARAYRIPGTRPVARNWHLSECLANRTGAIVIQPSSGPTPRIRCADDVVALAGVLSVDEVGWQLRSVLRALWGVALWHGVQLVELSIQTHRRHYAPNEIPWDVVAWAAHDQAAATWLGHYAIALDASYKRRAGRQHGAAAHSRISWLIQSLIDLGDEVLPVRPASDRLPTPRSMVYVDVEALAGLRDEAPAAARAA